MKFYSAICFCGLVLFNGCSGKTPAGNSERFIPVSDRGLDTATFAGGCYWCMDAAYEKLDGVKEVISGFAGGHVKDPSYEMVSGGSTGAREAVQVIFDPDITSYSELVDVFWREFDPTDDGGSFVDRGSQY